MAKIRFVGADDTVREVDVKYGVSIQEAAIQNDVEGIDAECGGACSCATCHVYIPEEWVEAVGPAGDLEGEMLGMVPAAKKNSRLSCQIEMSEELDGLTVLLPSEQVDVS